MNSIVSFMILAPLIIVGILYVLSLSKLLKNISPENRSMNPGLVWLLFVPILNFIWHFVVVLNVTRSTEKEFAKLGINEQTNSARTIGLVASIAWTLPLIINKFFDRAMSLMILLTMFASIVTVVTFIMFWVKTSSFNKKLMVHNALSRYKTS